MGGAAERRAHALPLMTTTSSFPAPLAETNIRKLTLVHLPASSPATFPQTRPDQTAQTKLYLMDPVAKAWKQIRINLVPSADGGLPGQLLPGNETAIAIVQLASPNATAASNCTNTTSGGSSSSAAAPCSNATAAAAPAPTELLLVTTGPWMAKATSKPTSYKLWVSVLQSDTGGRFEQLLPAVANGSVTSLNFVRRGLFVAMSGSGNDTRLLPDNT